MSQDSTSFTRLNNLQISIGHLIETEWITWRIGLVFPTDYWHSYMINLLSKGWGLEIIGKGIGFRQWNWENQLQNGQKSKLNQTFCKFACLVLKTIGTWKLILRDKKRKIWGGCHWPPMLNEVQKFSKSKIHGALWQPPK